MVLSVSAQNGLYAQKNLSFGRALTSKEKEEYKSLITNSRNELGSNNTSLICFDVSVPSAKGANTGIGTSFSKNAVDFLKFVKDMTGVNTLQVGPQGTITPGNRSPFSGSVFAVGEHVIDLKKLTTDDYEYILQPADYKKALVNDEKAETTTDYEHILGGAQRTALKAAFQNFQELDIDSPLKTAFADFKTKNSEWLERDALYEALCEKNGNDYWKNWPEETPENKLDKDLFSGKYSQEEVDGRKEEISKQYKDTIEFHEFCQFIADKQQLENKETLNKEGIKVFGDCLVGFSPRENWAYQSAFKENTYYGCKVNKAEQLAQKAKGESYAKGDWGLPAIDFDKIGDVENPGEAGKLLNRKFDSFFQKYDGARIDAAWQLIDPRVYSEFDSEGFPILQDKHYLGDKILKFMDASAKKIQGDDYSRENLNLEMLGGPVDLKADVLNGRTQIEHSIYQNNGWGSVNHYKNKGLSDKEYVFGLGTHDDLSLEQIADTKMNEQKPILEKNLKLVIGDKIDFMKAKFAEVFTARNNFFTVFDAFGVNKRFNDQSASPENWRARISSNYEELYFDNLSKGLGLNTADALAKALKAKGGNSELVAKLEQAAEVLKEKDGPLTEKDANDKLGKTYSALV